MPAARDSHRRGGGQSRAGPNGWPVQAGQGRQGAQNCGLLRGRCQGFSFYKKNK